jgi:hypothetical protein
MAKGVTFEARFGVAIDDVCPAETTPPRTVRAAGTPERGETNAAPGEAEPTRSSGRFEAELR